MSIATDERLQQVLTVSMEDIKEKVHDLVSNANVLTYEMKRRKMREAFEGPRIREPITFTQTGTYKRYSGTGYLSPSRVDLINSAEWLPRMGATTVVLTSEELLANTGRAQLVPLMASYIDSAKNELVDRYTEDLHSAGAATDQIDGLQAAIPTTVTTGTYGSISRTNAIWRTKAYDVSTAFSSVTTQTTFNSTGAQPMMTMIASETSRGNRGPNMFLMSQTYYIAYHGSLTAIQRINDETGVGKGGFQNLRFFGAGRAMDAVLEGGIGSAMPTGIMYGIDSDGLKYRYDPQRDFAPFGGKQRPVNQDILIQHMGFRGNLTQPSPIHMSKTFTP